MSLKKALSYIIQQKHNHNAALIEVLKNSVKEAKTQERIIFLLECKKYEFSERKWRSNVCGFYCDLKKRVILFCQT